MLSDHALEFSTYIISGVFTDSTRAAVVPSVATWKLTDTKGNVINARSAVSVPLATTFSVILTGNDLIVGHTRSNPQRVLTVFYTYNSSLGEIADETEIAFTVDKLVAAVVFGYYAADYSAGY